MSTTVSRRGFLASSAATAALVGLARNTRAADGAKPPNLIFVLSDDIGIGDIGCYGSDHYRTPHIDALAGDGLRFQACFSTPLCGPSRCQALTGRYPFRTQMTGNQSGDLVKPENEVMLPRTLKAAGYATASVGKWSQLPLQPGDFGFDEYLRFQGSGKYWASQANTYTLNGQPHPLAADKYLPDVMHEFVVDFMTRHREQPFYLHYPMSHCHGPIQHTPDSRPGAPKGEWYADNIAYMDKLVGRLVDEVQRLGLRERTLIVFTGDNGTQQGQIAGSTIGGQRLSGQKGSMLEGGSRVPLIAHWPGTVPAGKLSPDLIDFSDFYPTFAELAGAKLPAGVTIDGHSFAAQLRGEVGQPREWVYVQLNGKNYVRTAQYKLTGDGELFDMREAPFKELPVPPDSKDAVATTARAHLQTVLTNLVGPDGLPAGGPKGGPGKARRQGNPKRAARGAAGRKAKQQP